MQKKAFTLIELLVVIAIIALLASLLLPSLASAKSHGRSIKCLSNLKQQQLALTLYVQDNQKYPPFAMPIDPSHPSGQKWYSSLRVYTGNSWTNGIMICPSYTGPVFDGWIEQSLVYLSMGSYAYNVGIANNHGIYELGIAGQFGQGLSVVLDTSTREDTVKNPSDTICLGDSYSTWVGPPDKLTEGLEFLTRKLHTPENWQIIQISVKNANKRHDGKSNVSFIDGHAEKIGIYDLYFSKKEKDLQRWTTDNLPHLELYP